MARSLLFSVCGPSNPSKSAARRVDGTAPDPCHPRARPERTSLQLCPLRLAPWYDPLLRPLASYMPFDDRQEAYLRLRSIIAERTSPIVAWVGSGLSAPARIPVWEALRGRLVEAMKRKIDTYAPSERPRQKGKMLAAISQPNQVRRSYLGSEGRSDGPCARCTGHGQIGDFRFSVEGEASEVQRVSQSHIEHGFRNMRHVKTMGLG